MQTNESVKINVLVQLLKAYLDAPEGAVYSLIEVNSTGEVTVLGEFSTVEEALGGAADDYRALCEEGIQLKATQFVVGNTVDRVLIYDGCDGQPSVFSVDASLCRVV